MASLARLLLIRRVVRHEALFDNTRTVNKSLPLDITEGLNVTFLPP